MSRPATALINLNAIKNNYRYAKALGNGANTVMVIKANAYGHGAIEIAAHMDAEVDMFGVASIDEAQSLRESGIVAPILLMEGCFDGSEWPIASKLNLDVVVHSMQQWQELSVQDTAFSVWLKVDTGMHRLGFTIHEAEALISEMQSHDSVERLTLMTHLADADTPDSPVTQQQLKLFDDLARKYALPTSIANSAGLLFWPDSRSQWNRPGLMLYGTGFSANDSLPVELSPVMSLVSKVIAIRSIEAGEAVGYNCQWTASRASRIATVAIGYGDGYPRSAHNATPVVINGKELPLVGRVSMDMITVDVTDVPDVAIGDSVELWGNQLSVARVAEHCNSNSYEMLTRLAERVKKVFVTK